MTPCSNYNCHCHIEYLLQGYPTKIMADYCCPACRVEPDPPKATANNLWKVVRDIHQFEEPHYAAVRFELTLREPSVGMHKGPGVYVESSLGPPWSQPKFACIVSKQLIASGTMSLREIIARELNAYFAKSWPAHLREYLQTPDAACPSSWHQMGWTTAAADYFSATQQAVSGHQVMGDLERHIPGIRAFASCPACPSQHGDQVINLVQHLNDNRGWSREQIADWMEALDVDLSFPAEPPPKKVLPPARHDQKLFIFGPTQQATDYEIRRRRRDYPTCVAVPSHARTAMQRLRGHRDIQYYVVPGTYLNDEVLAELAMMGATEVGEDEDRGPEVQSMGQIMQQMYGKIEFTLTLADPKILGEHLPAVKEKPEVKGGHAILPTSHSSWTKFTQHNWKKEH